jgi:hypothetical protein
MPDFPDVGLGVAASVWSYATRTLTAGTNIILPSQAFPFTNPGSAVDLPNVQVGVSPTATGRAAKLDNLDATISGIPTAVWGAATRTLTGMTGQPRIDLLGEDASFEAGTGARKVKIDALLGTVADIEGTLTADGTEQTLVQTSDSKPHQISGEIDLTNMASGDTVVINYYIQMKSAGSFIKYASQTYSGAQSIPAVFFLTKTAKYGLKITLQQTAGTYRNFDYDFQKLVRS